MQKNFNRGHREGDRYNQRRSFSPRRQESKEKSENMIFGMHAVIEAIEAGTTIDKIFMKNDLTGDLAKELQAKASEMGLFIQRVPVEKLNRLTRKAHQGVVAFISPVPYYKVEQILPLLFEEGKTPFFLILDGITDTRNFGALARTADCSGVDAIVIPERGSATVTPEAVKTSAGSLFHIPVCRQRNLTECVRYLKMSGVKVVGASEKAAENYTEIDYSCPVAVVMGAEDVGISDSVLTLCDELASIPMLGNVESLNVSVAGGVMMYEVVRQRIAGGFSNS